MNRKPFYNSPYVINNNHAHAQSLTSAFFINENSGNSCRNLIDNENNISLNNMTWTANGISNITNSQYGVLDNSNETIINSIEGTVIAYFKSFSFFNDNSIRNIFTNNIKDGLIFGKYATNTLWLYFNNNSTSHYIQVVSSDVPTWETGVCIAWRWDLNNDLQGANRLAISINGVLVTPFSATRATTWNTNPKVSNIGILNDYSILANEANGELQYLFTYSKAIPDNLVKSIYDDPYAMVYKPNYLSNFIGAYAEQILPTTMDKRHKHFGANALPIGIGL